MRRPTPTGFDPRILADPRRGTFLPDTTTEERSALAGAIVVYYTASPPDRDMAGREDLAAWAHRCWGAIRDRVLVEHPRTTVSDMLSRPAFAAAPLVILDVLAVLLDARARRAALLEQVAALDVIEAAVRSPEPAA